MLVMWHARRVTAMVPPPLAGLLTGTAAYDELKATHPAIAINLVSNLARVVRGRLRRATRTIRHLAS